MGNTNSQGNEKPISNEPTPFGKDMLKEHFLFDPTYRNLNHGSFGTYPRIVQARLREIQDAHEARPDIFIRYEYPKLLDESRSAVANLLNVKTGTVVFVPNATTGVNTVLRNLVWNPDGKDEVLYFSFIYGACGKTIEYISEYTNGLVHGREINVTLPISDAALIEMVKSAITDSKSAGKRPRVLHLETIVSLPGVRLPFAQLTHLCKENGILSLIDGAHGIGHIPLDLNELDPDFFTSNCHKWLFAPRGCAVLYVPVRNQALMRSTLPTSHGFVPTGKTLDRGPLPAGDKSDFVLNFEFVGSIDSSPYLCIPEAVKFRKEVCGGEEAIMKYCIDLSRKGGKLVSERLGTKVLDNEEGTLAECAMVNVLLPIDDSAFENGDERKVMYAWMMDSLMEEYRTFVPVSYFQKGWWVRLSAQVYLDEEDFEWVGKALKVLCERVEKREYKK